MDFTITASAVVLSTIGLLFLAYTNRFLAIAALIRNLHDRYQHEHSDSILRQIKHLKHRIRLIRDMQTLSVVSLFFTVLSILLVFLQSLLAAKACFAISLIILLLSLSVSTWEAYISTKTLNIQLSSLAEQHEQKLQASTTP